MKYILILSLTALSLVLIDGEKEFSLEVCEEESRETINKLDIIHGVKFELINIGACNATLTSGSAVSFDGTLTDESNQAEVCHITITGQTKWDKSTTKVKFDCPYGESVTYSHNIHD